MRLPPAARQSRPPRLHHLEPRVLIEGCKVTTRYHDGKSYHARITAANDDGTYDVSLNDEVSMASVARQRLRCKGIKADTAGHSRASRARAGRGVILPYREGLRVRCRYRGGAKRYLGTIVAVHPATDRFNIQVGLQPRLPPLAHPTPPTQFSHSTAPPAARWHTPHTTPHHRPPPPTPPARPPPRPLRSRCSTTTATSSSTWPAA